MNWFAIVVRVDEHRTHDGFREEVPRYRADLPSVANCAGITIRTWELNPVGRAARCEESSWDFQLPARFVQEATPVYSFARL